MTAHPITVRHWKPYGEDGTYSARLVDAWSAPDLEPRYNQAGPWSVRVPFDEQSARIEANHLMTFDVRGFRMTGAITGMDLSTDERGMPYLELSGADVLSWLGISGFPVPSNPNPNTQDAVRYRQTGPAETVLRDVILANFDRLGIPLDIPPSLGRGEEITVNSRFKDLQTVVLRKADLVGLGVRMGLVSTTSSTKARLQLEFFEPSDRSRRFQLSHKVGTLKSWKQSRRAPTATRVIVGGGGRGVDRIFRQVIDSDAETEWGSVREVFVDARDESDPAVLVQRGREALLEATAQSGFELETAEAEGMRMFEHANLGDLITVEPIAGVSSTERIGAVKITADPALNIQVVPGNPDAANPLFGLAALIRGLRQGQSALEQEED